MGRGVPIGIWDIKANTIASILPRTESQALSQSYPIRSTLDAKRTWNAASEQVNVDRGGRKVVTKIITSSDLHQVLRQVSPISYALPATNDHLRTRKWDQIEARLSENKCEHSSLSNRHIIELDTTHLVGLPKLWHSLDVRLEQYSSSLLQENMVSKTIIDTTTKSSQALKWSWLLMYNRH